MSNRALWVGLDVAAEATSICVTDECGEMVLNIAVPSNATAIRAALPLSGDAPLKMIGLEAGGFGTHIARGLEKAGLPVTVYEARKLSKFLKIRRHKNDKNDARGIADVARLSVSAVAHVHVKSMECQRIRSELALRHRLLHQRMSGEGFIRSLLRLHGGKLTAIRSRKALRRTVEAEVGSIKARTEEDIGPLIDPLLDLCESIRVYIDIMDRRLRATALAITACNQMMKVSGVGPICALSFYSAIENPKRFQRVSDVGAYLGLVPNVRQSGETFRRGGISKMGSKMTRSHLVTAATVHLGRSKQQSHLRDWGLALADRIGRRKARVAVARKLAVTMLAMWRQQADFRPYPEAA